MFRLPYQIGIGILAIGLIWTLLTQPQWGLLRKRWDSSPIKILSVEVLGHKFGLAGKNGFPPAVKEGFLMLRVHVGFQAMPDMSVESIYLEYKGNRLLSTWEPDCINVGITYSSYIYFGVPKSVKAGKYKVRLVAFADGKNWFSKIFTIEFPEQN